MHQGLRERVGRAFAQVAAGLTQLDAQHDGFADGEAPAHEVIERDVAGHEVAARASGLELEVGSGGGGQQGFFLDQGQLVFGPRLRRAAFVTDDALALHQLGTRQSQQGPPPSLAHMNGNDDGVAANGHNASMPFRFRNDADLVDDVPATRRIMPFLMPTRNESLVFFDLDVDAARIDARVDALKARGLRSTVLHVVVAAAVAVLHERSRLNRFVAGGRLWQRRGIHISFSAKKEKSDKGSIVVVKKLLDPSLDEAGLAQALEGGVREARSDKESVSDKELKVLLALPTFLLALLVPLVKSLDAWGLLPKVFVDNDPLFASLFVANLGSLGMDAAQHHLYEYGNVPIFCVIGRKKHSFFVDDAGAVKVREVYPLRFTFDERIEDGLYCLKSLQLLKERIESA